MRNCGVNIYMLDTLKVFLETNGNKICKRTKKEEQGLTSQTRPLLRIGEKDVREDAVV